MTSIASVDQTTPAEIAAPATSRFMRFLGPLAAVLAMLSAVATFVVLADLTPIAPTHSVVVTLLLINALTVFLMVGIIAREVWLVVQARRRGRAAARLHVQIVGLFAVIAAVPAILVAVVASVTLDRGLDRLFSTRTRAIIENSLTVADAYLQEHAQLIRGDIMAMSFDVTRAKPLFDSERERFKQFFTAQARVRGLSAAMLIGANATIIERAEIQSEQPVPMPDTAGLTSVNETEPQIAMLFGTNSVAAVVKLRGYDNCYLSIIRPLDPRVVAHLRETQATVSDFSNLEGRRSGVQLAFALMYTVIALAMLLSAAWLGLNFANRLVEPIRRLIGAANVVSTGNLYVQVPVLRSEGDLAQLGETFNRMTYELRTQRDDIVRARDVIDQRRRFTEAVLDGASAGVIGVDAEGRISILNRSAEKLVDRLESDVIGHPLSEILPELKEIFSNAQLGIQRLVQGQVTISRRNRERNLSVRVTTEQSPDSERGYVITLDDITELVTAQRTSAWADIARRIAHEIKNPLTPIQLSAERLRRKYSAEITSDPQIFEQCTSTIIRQVGDIGRMVDEFSAFARMPAAQLEVEDLGEVVRQALVLQRVSASNIEFSTNLPETGPIVAIDRRLVTQAVTNLVKNAGEAIEARLQGDPAGNGHIQVAIRE